MKEIKNSPRGTLNLINANKPSNIKYPFNDFVYSDKSLKDFNNIFEEIKILEDKNLYLREDFIKLTQEYKKVILENNLKKYDGAKTLENLPQKKERITENIKKEIIRSLCIIGKKKKYFEECSIIQGTAPTYSNRATDEIIISKFLCHQPYCIPCAQRSKNIIAKTSIEDFDAIYDKYKINVFSLNITLPDELGRILTPILQIENLIKDGYRGKKNNLVINHIIKLINETICELVGFPKHSNLTNNIAIHYIRRNNYFAFSTHFHCLVQLIAKKPNKLSRSDTLKLEKKNLSCPHFSIRDDDTMLNSSNTFDKVLFSDLLLSKINNFLGTDFTYLTPPDVKYLSVKDNHSELAKITNYNHKLQITNLIDATNYAFKEKYSSSKQIIIESEIRQNDYIRIRWFLISYESLAQWWRYTYTMKKKGIGYKKLGFYAQTKKLKTVKPKEKIDMNNLQFAGMAKISQNVETKEIKAMIDGIQSNIRKKTIIRPINMLKYKQANPD